MGGLSYLWRSEIEPLLERVAEEGCIETENWVVERTEGGLVLIYPNSGDATAECGEGEAYVEGAIDELAREIEPGVKVVVDGWALEKTRGGVIAIYRDRRATIKRRIEEVCEKLREEEELEAEAALDTLLAMLRS